MNEIDDSIKRKFPIGSWVECSYRPGSPEEVIGYDTTLIPHKKTSLPHRLPALCTRTAAPSLERHTRYVERCIPCAPPSPPPLSLVEKDRRAREADPTRRHTDEALRRAFGLDAPRPLPERTPTEEFGRPLPKSGDDIIVETIRAAQAELADAVRYAKGPSICTMDSLHVGRRARSKTNHRWGGIVEGINLRGATLRHADGTRSHCETHTLEMDPTAFSYNACAARAGC